MPVSSFKTFLNLCTRLVFHKSQLIIQDERPLIVTCQKLIQPFVKKVHQNKVVIFESIDDGVTKTKLPSTPQHVKMKKRWSEERMV